jgi:hypothetical protein
MTRLYPALLLLPLAACLSTTDGEECVSVRRGISEAAGTVTIRFVSSRCAGAGNCGWEECSPVVDGVAGELECRFPVGAVGDREGHPPAHGCDVVGWDDRRAPSEPQPTYVALRCADPGPYLFFGLPDLRALDSDWPLSMPVAVNAEPTAQADGPGAFNPWSDEGMGNCEVAARDSSHLDGLIELGDRTGGPGDGGAVDPGFRISVRVDGHIPERVAERDGLTCTEVVGLDFRLNLIQTAADYAYCEGE